MNPDHAKPCSTSDQDVPCTAGSPPYFYSIKGQGVPGQIGWDTEGLSFKYL